MSRPRHLYKETASSSRVKFQTRYENVWHLYPLAGFHSSRILCSQFRWSVKLPTHINYKITGLQQAADSDVFHTVAQTAEVTTYLFLAAVYTP